MSENPATHELEVRAADQRRRLHNSVSELSLQVHEKLDMKRKVRQYFWQATGVSALLALIVGYGFTGMFTRR